MSSAGGWRLAQMNIARMRAPLTDPLMARFVAQLDEINALADSSPGFVWRLQEAKLEAPLDAESEEALAQYAADAVIVNLSLWESVEALQRFVYHSAHAPLLKDRRDWFEKFEGRWSVLWWIPAGGRPTVADGKRRLRTLEANGCTAEAFNFKQPFPSPDSQDSLR